MKKADFLAKLSSDEGVTFLADSRMRIGVPSHRRSVRGALTGALNGCLPDNEEVRFAVQDSVAEKDWKGTIRLYLVLRHHVAEVGVSYEVDSKFDVPASVSIDVSLSAIGPNTVVRTKFHNTGAGLTPATVTVEINGLPKTIELRGDERTAPDLVRFGAAVVEASL